MSDVTAHCLKLLEGFVDVPPEKRVDTLHDVAFAFGQFAAGGVLPEKALEALLQQARSLAVDIGEHAATEAISGGLEKGKKTPRQAPEQPTATTADKLPSGFSLRPRGEPLGLWHEEHKKDGDPAETWIGPPLHILSETRDEHSNAWGLLLEWADPDGRRHTWAMPKAMLAGKDASAWLSRLADEGWSCAPGNKARNLLASYLGAYRTTRRAFCVPRTGWHKGVFVFPDSVISDTLASPSEERIVLQVQTPHNPFLMAGTLEGWQSTIGEVAKGNSRLALSLCASLAAPLLEVAGQESGGFNFAGQSSTGKTTALVAAGSVWGKGTSSGGYVQNWRATANGLEGLAALHSDTALCLDEIGQASGRAIQEAAYMLANGTGKARAFQDGSAKAAKSWRCMVLSTGEVGLAEKIAEEGGRVKAGQAVRLIDIPADAGVGLGLFENLHGHASAQAFADALKQAASTHYGHAARSFIAKFQQHRAEATDALHKGLAVGLEHFCLPDVDGQVKRVAKRFLLCALAGEMAAEWGLLPWEKGEALAAAKACFDAWVSRRGGVGAAEDTAIVEQVTLFIEQHGASRFQDVDEPGPLCVNRAGFRKAEGDGGTVYYVPKESFKEVCRGHDVGRAARVLRDAGILRPDPDGKHLACFMRLPGIGRARCYVLQPKQEQVGVK